MVGGYTDNVPIGTRLMRRGITSNLVLSQKRADNVMQFMISQGVKPSLISAHGFGDADPVASNDTADGQAQTVAWNLHWPVRATKPGAFAAVFSPDACST